MRLRVDFMRGRILDDGLGGTSERIFRVDDSGRQCRLSSSCGPSFFLTSSCIGVWDGVISCRRRFGGGCTPGGRRSAGKFSFDVVTCVISFVVLNRFLVLVWIWFDSGVVVSPLGHGV